jgi:hypothetical protein
MVVHKQMCAVCAEGERCVRRWATTGTKARLNHSGLSPYTVWLKQTRLGFAFVSYGRGLADQAGLKEIGRGDQIMGGTVHTR